MPQMQGLPPHAGVPAIERRTTRHQGYAKQWGGLWQFKLRGTEKVGAVFGLHVIAYNLIHRGNLFRPAPLKAACGRIAQS